MFLILVCFWLSLPRRSVEIMVSVGHYCHKGQEVDQGGGKSNPPLQCKWRGQPAAAHRDSTFKVFEFYYSHSLYSSRKTGVSFASMILVLKRFEKVFDNLICSDCLFFLLIDFRRFSFKKVFELLELIWIEMFFEGNEITQIFFYWNIVMNFEDDWFAFWS